MKVHDFSEEVYLGDVHGNSLIAFAREGDKFLMLEGADYSDYSDKKISKWSRMCIHVKTGTIFYMTYHSMQKYCKNRRDYESY